MLLKIFIYLYFPLLSIGVFFSDEYKIHAAKGLVFVISFLFILFWISFGKNSKLLQGKKFDKSGILLYSFIILYSILYFPRRAESTTIAFLSTPLLLFHTMFWDFLIIQRIKTRKIDIYFKDLFYSIFIGMLFLFVTSFSFVNFSLVPGSIHDIAEEFSLLQSDLDVPFMLLILFTFVISHLRNKQKNQQGMVLRFTMLFLPIITFFILWLYARRAPMFIMALLLPFIFVSVKFRNKLFILFSIFPFIPLFWDFVSNLLIDITQTSFVASIFARNNISDYLTATNRTIDWIRGISFLLDFKIKHLIGYGGPPWFVVSANRDHMHNLILTMVFDSGIIVLLLFLWLFYFLIRKSFAISENFKNNIWGAEALHIILFIFIFFSPVEPLLHAYSVEFLIFLIFSVTIIRVDQFHNLIKCSIE